MNTKDEKTVDKEVTNENQSSLKERRIKDFQEFMTSLKLEQEFIDTFTHFLVNCKFFNAPASTKYHGAYSGGLFDHSFTVAKVLIDMTKALNLNWTRPESPFIIGMCHDFCKIDQYYFKIAKEQGKDDMITIEYNTNTLLKGHGEKSVMVASQFFALTPEEIMCIRYHMGAFGNEEEQKLYGNAVQVFPNVLWTHTADMVASKIYNV